MKSLRATRGKSHLSIFTALLFVFLTSASLGAEQLRVALFPYIPDSNNDKFDALEKYLESEFERRFPMVDLHLRPIEDGGFYDVDNLVGWLTQSNGYDVVEIDTLLLGDLVSRGAIMPWRSIDDKDWFPVAKRSVLLNDVPYGVPHLLCGHFIFSRSGAVTKSKNAGEFITRVKAISNTKRDLVGNFVGSWNMPALYVDAWSDSWKLAAANSFENIDPVVLKDFKRFAACGEFDGSNACLNGSFDWPNENVPPALFAAKEADALIGYSERLHHVLKSGAIEQEIHIASAPLGAGSNPILFVDALVLRRGANRSVQEAAENFAKFLNSPEIQERLLMSGETGTYGIPRYLMPATKSVYSTKGVRSDRFYRQFQKVSEKANPYPNIGFPSIRKELQATLTKELQSP